MTLIQFAALVFLISTSGCSKETTPVSSITQLPHSMPISKVEPVEPTLTVTTAEFMPIFFQMGKHDIHRSQQAKLDSHSIDLINNPDMRIKLVGGASEEGTAASNMQLGQLRAVTIKNYLILAGVSADRIITASSGEAANVYSGKKEKLNRRVDFVIMP